MDITESPDGFKPFFMRIDSKTEADFLWHLLNNETTMTFTQYLKEEKLKNHETEYKKLKTQFYQRLEKHIQKQTLTKEAKE